MYRRPRLLPRSSVMRPERKIAKRSKLERAGHWVAGRFKRPIQARLQAYSHFLSPIHKWEEELHPLSDQQLKEAAAQLRQRLHHEGHTDELLGYSFALIREVAGRTVGMYHFDSQLLCGLALFHGNIAEMMAGEGKTLAATLPAAAAALAGIPVHVITVNDYLAKRDAELMQPVYHFLGLSVGEIIQGKSLEERRRAYACDVVYCTNKELTFDYLKDLIQLKEKRNPLHLHAERLKGEEGVLRTLLMRGLHFGIVDEADSVLMDEARTPLIISGQEITNREEMRVYRQAIELAAELVEGEHYHLDLQQRQAELTAEGERFVTERTQALSPYWIGSVRRLELMNKALLARYLFKRDKHYLVRDAKIQIIDEHTGRVMPDRAWERGLHQLIEIKEGCEPSKARETLARISYQRFFRLYHHLGGMTGTAKEVTDEFWSVYDLPVVKVPTNKPCQRRYLGTQVYPNVEQKWQGVLCRILELKALSRPVLVGTHSVGASENLSQLLSEVDIVHQVLNAKQDGDEAKIVAQAGQTGQVTIATNMAGRGTDIKLSPDVEAAGGLYVILTELHEAGRIDRQLEGRSARQGDPGSYEVMISLDDFVLRSWHGNGLGRLLLSCLKVSRLLCNSVGLWVMKIEQKRLERLYAKRRGELLKADEQQSEMLSFAGRGI